MRGQIRKELQDLLPWIPLGMVVVGYLSWVRLIGSSYPYSSFEESAVSLGGIGCVLVACLFGFIQVVRDSRIEAKGFLLHRPLSVSQIFWAKISAGAIAYGVTLIVPMLALAAYLEYLGPEQGPYSGKQVLPLALYAIVFFAFHPTVIWLVTRDVSWWNPTKLLLLGVPFLGAIIAAGLRHQVTGYFSWVVWVPFTISMTLGICLLAAHHNFCIRQFQPPTSKIGWCWSETLGLSFVCVVAASIALYYVASVANRSWADSADSSYTLSKRAISSSGEIWELEEEYQAGIGQYAYTGRKLKQGKPEGDFRKIPEDFKEQLQVAFDSYSQRSRTKSWKPIFDYAGTNTFGDTIYISGGRLFYYRAGLLVAVVTPRGFFGPDEVPQGRFEDLRKPSYARFARYEAYGQARIAYTHFDFVADDSGIYQIKNDSRTVNRIIDESPSQFVIASVNSKTWNLVASTNMAGDLSAEPQAEVEIWALKESKLKKYELKALDDNSKESSKAAAKKIFHLPAMQVVGQSMWPIEPMDQSGAYDAVTVAELEDKLFLIRNRTSSGESYLIRNRESVLEEGKFAAATLSSSSNPLAYMEAYFLPPIVTAFVATSNFRAAGAISLYQILPSLILSLVVSIWVSGRFALTLRSRLIWGIAAGCLGLGIPLAIYCLYPPVVREVCAHCGVHRRVDLGQCEFCGAVWERPDPTGNEIIGPRLLTPAETAV